MARAALAAAAVAAALGALAAPASADQLFADDLVIQRLCAGTACANGEVFGSEMARFKAIHPQVRFEDSETTAGEPTTEWALQANDADFDRFMLKNLTTGATPLTVLGAGGNAGHVGFTETDPQLDLHMESTDTPGIRFEQTNARYTAQTWDVGGNEANFFVRDITGGSKLPFRVRPGAPTSSVDIAANGNVGIGVQNAESALHLSRGTAPSIRFDSSFADTRDWEVGTVDSTRFRLRPADGGSEGLTLQPDGDVAADGVLEQSASGLEGGAAVDASSTLAKVRALPVTTWELSGDAENTRHIGPSGQDFFDSFGVGSGASQVAPGDLAGVALVGVKALDTDVTALDTDVTALDGRVTGLGTSLAALDTEVDGLGSSLGALDTRVGGIDSRVGDVDRLLAAVDTRLKSLEDGSAPTSASLADLTKRLAALEEGKKKSDLSVASLQSANKKLAARLRAVEKKLRSR